MNYYNDDSWSYCQKKPFKEKVKPSTEMQVFLDKFGRELRPDDNLWLSRFNTLSEAWDQCQKPELMISILQLANLVSNYHTSLLIFVGNIINISVDFLHHDSVRRLWRDLSCLLAQVVQGMSGKDFNKERDRMIVLVSETRYKYSSLSRKDREACARCSNFLQEFQYPDAVAISAIAWYNTSILPTEYKPLLTEYKLLIDCAQELRTLIGNPFGEANGN